MTSTDTKKILIVDDDPDILEQLEIFITKMGMETIQADSQGEAERIISSDEKFDMAILDLMMEQNDSGFILAHKIKKNNPDTPIILLTAVASEAGIKFDALSESERSWIKTDRIMDKDIRFEQLKKEITQLLRN